MFAEGQLIEGWFEPGEADSAPVTEAVAEVPPHGPPPVAEDPPSMWPMLAIWGAVFVGMWFLMIRPQRKREKKMRELQAAITVGNDIITSGGLFGKVIDVGEDCFIVEFGTNKGVRIPVLKSDVVAQRTPNMTLQAPQE